MHPLCINEASGGNIGVTTNSYCGVADKLGEVSIFLVIGGKGEMLST